MTTSPPLTEEELEEKTCDEHITHSTLRRTIVTSAFPSIGRRFARSHQEEEEKDDFEEEVVKVVVFSAESMCVCVYLYIYRYIMLYYVQVDSIERLPDVHGREEILSAHQGYTSGAGIRFVVYIYRPFFSFFYLELFFTEKKRDKNPKPTRICRFLNPNTKVFRAIFLPFFSVFSRRYNKSALVVLKEQRHTLRITRDNSTTSTPARGSRRTNDDTTVAHDDDDVVSHYANTL